ncbi:general secretion pathway protein D [Candidatus Velamenicoccus archaeovorus]|uniref:General secretion pathway protein D n=1 Tax=Velamenicoccus archaeovorus TaxID=1930593 RepID=A0A410P3H0_VELA1|nr:hypothetical protein [Candidatus Velamenicoccus archaeovorus]QAT16683.1 general secretion pathway protein D [Candidatus Velamenicoccus archaeovorus]
MRANSVSIRTILGRIGELTGLNVVYDPEFNSDTVVALDVQDASIWQVLSDVLFPLSSSFKVKDKSLIIVARETRVFKLSLPPGSQDFSDTVSNESWTNPEGNTSNNTGTLSGATSNMSVKVGAKVFVETKEGSISFWKDMETNLSKMISARGKYSFNKPAGLVVVSDNPICLDEIGRYIDLVNAESSKQILIEVKVLEVSLSRQNAGGIDWNAIYKNLAGIKKLTLSSNFTGQSIASGSLFTLSAASPKDDSGTGSNGLSVLIQALESQGKVEVISQPKVMLLNNQSAMVQVGTVTSYVSNTTTTATQAGLVATSANTDQVQEGVTLRLMASIRHDEILVQLTPVVTTLDQIRSISMGSGVTIEAPKTSTRSMHTLVKIKDGQTIAVGGLITSNDTKSKQGIPVLSELPFVGRLFEFKNKSLTRTELVIFITPKILPR